MKHEIKMLLGITNKNIEIIKVEEKIIKSKRYKVIFLKNNKKKCRCPECNQFTSSVHDILKPIKLKDLKISENDTLFMLQKRRFCCHKCRKIFTESLNLSLKNSTISNRLKIKIRKDLLNYHLSLSDIAKQNNVSDNTVRNELKNIGNMQDSIKSLPRVISFDEFKADTNRGKYAFIMNDPIHKKTLNILPSRKKEDLINYFSKIDNRHSVEYVISDMYEPYLLVTKIMFPKAKYVVDRFHYVTYIMDALDNIRIKLQNTYGYNDIRYRTLKNKKNVNLLRKYGNDINWFVYTKRYKNGKQIEVLPYDILNELLEYDDELKRGYQLKELFLDIVHNCNYNNVLGELTSWIDLCKESKIKEFIDASNTISNWLPYIVNSFIDSRFTNGYTEGLNNKIKVIKRNAFGYKNFDFFRLRLMYVLNGKIGGQNKNKISKNIKKDTF